MKRSLHPVPLHPTSLAAAAEAGLEVTVTSVGGRNSAGFSLDITEDGVYSDPPQVGRHIPIFFNSDFLNRFFRNECAHSFIRLIIRSSVTGRWPPVRSISSTLLYASCPSSVLSFVRILCVR